MGCRRFVSLLLLCIVSQACWETMVRGSGDCASNYLVLGYPISDLNKDQVASIEDCEYAMLRNSSCGGNVILYNDTEKKCICETTACGASTGIMGYEKKRWRCNRTTTSITTAVIPTTTTATSSSSTTPLGTILRFEMGLTVTNAEDFVRQPDVAKVLKQPIAEMTNTPVSWVHNVTVKLRPPDRKLESGDVLEKGGDVCVTWCIEVPPNGEITATIVIGTFDELSLTDATRMINIILQTNVLGPGFEAIVRWKHFLAFTEGDKGIADESSKGTEVTKVTEASPTSLFYVIAGCAFCLLVLLAILCIRCRKVVQQQSSEKPATKAQAQFAKKAGPLAKCGLLDLLRPPDTINVTQGESIRQLVRAMLYYEPHEASVFLTYALGQRPDDEELNGPGMYFAASLVKMLFDNKVKCFCNLMYPAGAPQRKLSELLGTRFGSSKILLVLQTKALYESHEALTEIFTAQNEEVEIIPLRFEKELPKPDDEWLHIEREDLSGVMMLTAVQQQFGKLNSIPSPPYTVVEEPVVLEDLLLDLRLKLTGARRTGQQAMGQMSSMMSMLPSMVGLSTLKRQLKSDAQPHCKAKKADETYTSLRRQSYGSSAGTGSAASQGFLEIHHHFARRYSQESSETIAADGGIGSQSLDPIHVSGLRRSLTSEGFITAESGDSTLSAVSTANQKGSRKIATQKKSAHHSGGNQHHGHRSKQKLPNATVEKSPNALAQHQSSATKMPGSPKRSGRPAKSRRKSSSEDPSDSQPRVGKQYSL